MAVSMTGKMGDEGGKVALKKTFIDQNVYIGFTTAAITDASTLATITEYSGVSRTQINSNLPANPSIVSNKAQIANSTEISTGNASTAGTEVVGWFITDASTGTTGNILAYGNASGSGVFTNSGEPIKIAAGELIITLE